MLILRNLAALAMGVTIPLTVMTQSGPAQSLQAGAQAAVQELAQRPVTALFQAERPAEVAVAFDAKGQVASSALRASTGSAASDAAALSAALELASLRQPADVAGRTLLFRANFAARAVS